MKNFCRLYVVMVLVGVVAPQTLSAHAESADATLPRVPDGFTASVFAADPMVRNPCAISFDARGRLFVSQGQQYRKPTPDTPGDRVTLLIDRDGDGTADEAKTFAQGFNHIQGLAWRGDELWIANAPDLTVVRDTDGDDVADEYKLVYGGLGNIEHALHGLNFAPDGKLYFSKGNSKGYGKADSPERHIAPPAFFDLWGTEVPPDSPTAPINHVSTQQNYKRGYHHPSDDWGKEGGVLRCDPDGSNIEIVSRGFRNPWDITYDEHFNWLGTDQDQTGGDRIVQPFFGAHFGWGHPWSPHWTGENHLPTIPISGPTFEGSGTGVVYAALPHFPEEFRGVFFINDWLKRQVYVYRPRWEGAMMRDMGKLEVFAAAPTGRAMGSSSGILFDPVDIKVGPDGAIWIVSWGHGYGATIKGGRQVDQGRIYRITFGDTTPSASRKNDKRSKPYARWSDDELIADLHHNALPVWRTRAQQELVGRGSRVIDALKKALSAASSQPGASTWLGWTLGLIKTDSQSLDNFFIDRLTSSNLPLPDRIQAIRILGHRISQSRRQTPDAILDALNNPEPRIRFAAIQAIGTSHHPQHLDRLWNMAANENDRATFYTTWQTIGSLANTSNLRQHLADSRSGVRLAALLTLLEQGKLTGDEVAPLRLDTDHRVAQVASSFVDIVGTHAEPVLVIQPAATNFTNTIDIHLETSVSDVHVRYTLDGSAPTDTTGIKFERPISISKNTTLKTALFRERVRVGPILTKHYQRSGGGIEWHDLNKDAPPLVDITAINSQSNSLYQLDQAELQLNGRPYTNRSYAWKNIPEHLVGASVIQTANGDADVGSIGNDFLHFTLDSEAEVYIAHDRRIQDKPAWLNTFESTGTTLATRDTIYDLFKKVFPAGKVALGGNTKDGQASRRSQYVVIATPAPLKDLAKPTTVAEVQAISTTNTTRGRWLFYRQAACHVCHNAQDGGNRYAPDLADLNTRGDLPAIAEAILNPSAVITEGYHGMVVTTNDDKAYTGFIKQESGLALELIQVNGQTVSIPTQKVTGRQRLETSVMPPHYASMMNPQQVADMIAYLRTQDQSAQTPPSNTATASTTNPPNDPRYLNNAPLPSIAAQQPTVGQTWGNPKNGFHITSQQNHLRIQLDGQPIATYTLSDPIVKRPYFANIKSTNGTPITRPYPPVKGIDPDDHSTMHPGLWMAFGRVGKVNGQEADFWRNKGEITHEGFAALPSADAESASFETLNRFVAPDGEVICRQAVSIRINRVAEGYFIRIDARFASDEPFYFGVQEEMGFGIRMATPLTVKYGNGAIINNTGGVNEKGTWGKAAQWWNAYGPANNRTVGAMLMSHPDNGDVWSHSRNYGCLVANPFAIDKKANRNIQTLVSANQTFRLRFGVLIHDQPKGQPINGAKNYHRYLAP